MGREATAECCEVVGDVVELDVVDETFEHVKAGTPVRLDDVGMEGAIADETHGTTVAECHRPVPPVIEVGAVFV